MAEYRNPEFTLEQRLEASIQMLLPLPDRKWGTVTQLAERHGVSRTLLYQLRDQAKAALVKELLPGEAGRPVETTTLEVDKTLVDRTITVLPLLKGSVRDIHQGLDLLFGVNRSVGYISKTLRQAGEQAADQNSQLRVPLPILGEADEIFQGRKPCLTIVDGRSFLVLNLAPSESRDATSWGVTYLELMERGIQFHDLACDGGTGLRAGAKEAQLEVPLRPDLFHLMQDAHRLTRRLETTAYKAIETAERACQAELEAQGVLRRPGPRLKIKVPLPQAQQEQAQTIAIFDTWRWLVAEIRQAVEPFTPTGQLASSQKSQANVETALELLRQLNHAEVSTFADSLQKKLAELLSPLEWLEQQLTPLLAGLEADTRHFILWCWRHRHELKLDIATDIPPHLRQVVQAVWDILGLFHRSSSLAESLHSWLRPYLQIHRGMPEWLLPLLQLYWNHHQFERGKRAGSSPLELAGVEDAPSLKAVLEQLLAPQPAPSVPI